MALYKDNKLQLLVSLVGFSRLGDPDDPDAPWVIPPSLTPAQLDSSLAFIKKFEFDPPTYEDGKAAIDFIRSKAAGERARRPKASYDDDSEGSGDDDFLFPLGGPTNRKADALEELKKQRRVRRSQPDESDVDDEEGDRKAEERRAKKQAAELEKRRKIKSDLFVHESDEEEDEERDRVFFEKEEAVRKKTADAVAKALMEVRDGAMAGKNSKKRKKRSGMGESRKKRKTALNSADEEVEGGDDLTTQDSASSHSSSVEVEDLLKDGTGDEGVEVDSDTPISSQQRAPDLDGEDASIVNSISKPRSTSTAVGDRNEDEIPPPQPSRRLVRAGFIVDSDSDE